MQLALIVLAFCLMASVVCNAIGLKLFLKQLSELDERSRVQLGDLQDKAFIDAKEKQIFLEGTRKRMDARADVLKNMHHESKQAEDEEGWAPPTRFPSSHKNYDPDFGAEEGPQADENMISEEVTGA